MAAAVGIGGAEMKNTGYTYFKDRFFNRAAGSLHFGKVLLLLLLCSLLTGVSFEKAVNANEQKVVDMADLLTAEEESVLQKRLASLSEEYQCDVVAATTNTFEGKNRQDYTDEFFYEEGYGYGKERDGIILMVNLNDREFHYATRGTAIRVFTDRNLETIDERVTPYLSAGEFADAFLEYADLAEHYLENARQRGVFEGRAGMSVSVRILISLGVGLGVTIVVLLVLFGQLRTVRAKGQAKDYVRSGSFRVTGARDINLYRTISKHRIEKEHGGGGGGGSRTHSAPGGGRSGGRGGSF